MITANINTACSLPSCSSRKRNDNTQRWLLIKATLALLGVLVSVLFLAAPSFPGERPAAVVNRTIGQAGLKKPGSDADTPVLRGSELFVGDVVTTGQSGVMQLVFVDGAYIVLGKNTAIRINQYAYNQTSNRRTARVRLLKGEIRLVLFKILRDDSYVEVETEHAIINHSMVSDAIIDVRSGETIAAVLGGTAVLRNASPYIVGSSRLNENMKSLIRTKASPSSPEILTSAERASYLKDFILYD